MQSKRNLRAKLKRQRSDLPNEAWQQKSSQIVERLKTALEWQNVSSLHCFEPLRSQKESNINPLIVLLQRDFPGLNIFTSRKIDGAWQVVRLDGNTFVQAPKFDAVIVPMLGFDNRLHRLGYGGGYYDQFLAGQPGASKIGVCFELGHVQAVPVEPHDIAMDTIITEHAAYT